MKKLLTIALFAACSTFSIHAFAKDARCKISIGEETQYNGRCSFTFMDKEGSFSIANKNKRYPLYDDIYELELITLQKNYALVREIDTIKRGYEHDTKWGHAIRSLKDRACWEGVDGTFEICAY